MSKCIKTGCRNEANAGELCHDCYRDKHIEDILLNEDYPDIDVRSILRAIYHQSKEPFLSSGYVWRDKPHRVMADCCCKIEQLEREHKEHLKEWMVANRELEQELQKARDMERSDTGYDPNTELTKTQC